MKILWLELAEEDVESIYQFYAKDKSIKAANRIYNDILDATDSLADFPQMASIEPELSDDGEEFRSLVVRKHFKIIYFIESDSIYIAAVWDCRQNPQTNVNKIRS